MRPAPPDEALERYSTRQVVFAHPFTLGSSPEAYPAGAYEVETKVQPIEFGAHTALVRTSTVLIIPTPTGTCSRVVSGSELECALMHDAGPGPSGEPGDTLASGRVDPLRDPEELP
jgi:hypothetical protein